MSLRFPRVCWEKFGTVPAVLSLLRIQISVFLLVLKSQIWKCFKITLKDATELLFFFHKMFVILCKCLLTPAKNEAESLFLKRVVVFTTITFGHLQLANKGCHISSSPPNLLHYYTFFHEKKLNKNIVFFLLFFEIAFKSAF